MKKIKFFLTWQKTIDFKRLTAIKSNKKMQELFDII